MEIQLKYKPGFAMALVTLNEGEKIRAEGGAMVGISTNINMVTEKASRGGILRSLKAAFLGGENFWMNVFSSTDGKAEIKLAPTLPGDIIECDLNNGTLYAQSTCFLAADSSIDIDTKFQGLKGFFSGESLFFLKLSGTGKLLLSSYGGIEKISVQGSFLVDTGHIVAFDNTLNYQIIKFGGWKSFFFGGEGLVARFTGNGNLYIQSRSVPEFGRWLRDALPPKKE
ncbi:MAG: TIGR00266 family protein [Spirochaetia bacterium]|nr:TIGR00266 family protein [Spirochaetia bacterium]